MKELIGNILIIIAGLFWGSMGIFVRHLNALGFTSIQVAAMRIICAALIFALILLIKDRKGFKIRPRDIPLFLGLGLASILFFTCCYFTAIRIMTMSAAAILLYTSPIWVMLMSLIVFKEKITVQKVIALALAFGGCVLVSGIAGGEADAPKLTAAGILIGLGSGIGYGLYSILGTIALRRYKPYTVTAYTFFIAGLGSLVVCDLPDMAGKIAAQDIPELIGFVILTAIITAVIPFLLYTLGLARTTADKAAILATVEPAAATAFGYFVMGESIGLPALVGVIFVFMAIIVLNLRREKRSIQDA